MTNRDGARNVSVVEDISGIGPRLVRWWRSIPPLVADAVLAAVILAVTLVEISLNDESLSGRNRAVSIALLVAMSVVIVFRRRWPVAVWLVSGALVTIYGVASFPDPVLPYGPLVAVYTVAAYTSWRTSMTAGVVTAVVVAASMIIDPHDDIVDWLIAFLSTTTAWLIGNNVRTYRAYTQELEAKAARLESERRAEAERAVADERLRLARELHDVAAHHVSVIALHAEAGQSLLPDDPERADQAFGVIGQVARTTLTELRRVVGVLRDDDGAAPLVPQPGLQQLPALVREVERAGVPVTLTVSGAPGPISPTLDTSAYRIVQEALTNVLRHAGPATAHVTVTYEPDAVAVEVLDDGAGPIGSAPAESHNGGHGLAGMRERAAMFGGTLTAEARPERGFAVSARLPR
jgi:signal transduction histidine kinase